MINTSTMRPDDQAEENKLLSTIIDGEDSMNDSGHGSTTSSVHTVSTSKAKEKPEASSSSRTMTELAGDIIWKSLIVVLLSLIGAAAGFAFLYGLITRDQLVTEKVRRHTCSLPACSAQ